MCPESEDRNVLLLGLVEFAELAAEFFFGDVGTVGVEDVAASRLSDLFPSAVMVMIPRISGTYTTI